MTNDDIGQELKLIMAAVSKVEVSIGKIETKIQHIIEEKITGIENQISHLKDINGKQFNRIERLENAPAVAALKSKEEKNSIIQKALIGALITLLFGIGVAFIGSQMKLYYSQPQQQQTSQEKSIDAKELAILPKHPNDPVDDGEYCEVEEDKKEAYE